MRSVSVAWASGRQEAVRLPRGATAGRLRALLAAPAPLLRLSTREGRALADAEPCPGAVAASVALRGGYSSNKSSYVLPAVLSVTRVFLFRSLTCFADFAQVVFVALCIAGPVLVAQESSAGRVYATLWWVGMAFCIAAAVLLVILLPVWIYLLCCD